MSNQAGEMVIRPASIFARSSRSSTISLSSMAAPLMNIICLCCSALSGPSSSSLSSRVMLRIEPNGVLNSWLM